MKRCVGAAFLCCAAAPALAADIQPTEAQPAFKAWMAPILELDEKARQYMKDRAR